MCAIARAFYPMSHSFPFLRGSPPLLLVSCPKPSTSRECDLVIVTMHIRNIPKWTMNHLKSLKWLGTPTISAWLSNDPPMAQFRGNACWMPGLRVDSSRPFFDNPPMVFLFTDILWIYWEMVFTPLRVGWPPTPQVFVGP